MRKLRTRIKGIVSPFHYGEKSGHQNTQHRLVMSNLAIQDKLLGHTASAYRISSNQDAHEQEAEAMADRVMRMGSGDSPVSSSPGRVGAAGYVQTKSNNPATHTTNNGNATAISGAGQTLTPSSRSFFETRFGHDLGHVRIHNDPSAHETAKNLNARAFTQNNHIGFDSGQYDPDSYEGKHLLAHVSQQTDSNTIYCESWNVDDSGREIERELLVQLIFEDTWSDMWNGTGWTVPRKNTFRSEFVSSIENTFNNSSFVIKPPPSYGDVLPPENVEQGYKPLVDIDLVPDGEWSSEEDWEVDVSSNPTSEFRTSSSSTSYGTLDEADNTAVTKQGAVPGVTQIPTVHEFGHFIDLDHPGEGLEGGLFSDSQLSPGADEYSHTGTDVEGRTVHGPSDLMGSGMGLRPFYYDAWAVALDEHVDDLRRAAQQQQFQRDWNMFERALGNDPAGVEWFARGLSGM